MTNLLQSLDDLKDWETYRAFLKVQLKLLANGDPVWVTKDKVDFDLDGKPFTAPALLVGEKGRMAVQRLRKEGLLFREGTCRVEGKALTLEGLPDKAVRGVSRTVKKLLLGYKVHVEGGEEGDEGEDEGESAAAPQPAATGAAGGAAPAAGELAAQAERIEKAIGVWRATEEAAKKELRKLQKAILDLGDPRATPVIRGLEGILTRLDKVDDEAREAAEAAKRGDQEGFRRARQDLLNKMNRIKTYVQSDELIRDADSNPVVGIKIAQTITGSLDRLMRAV